MSARTARLVATLGVCVAACLAAAPAGAHNFNASCSTIDPGRGQDITDAYAQAGAPGVPKGESCNANLYNAGHWSSVSELAGYVNGVLNACNDGNSANDAYHRSLVQAITENTGTPPHTVNTGFSTVAATNLCSKTAYDNYETSQGGSVDWTSYDGAEYGTAANVRAAVSNTFSTCGHKDVSEALVQVTGAVAPAPATSRVTGEFYDNGSRGRCYRSLYNSGDWGEYDNLVGYVSQWSNSTTTCTDPWVNQALQEVSGWSHPVSYTCDIHRYADGTWSSYDNLKQLVAGSFRCFDTWIGEVYTVEGLHDYGARGDGDAGECNKTVNGIDYMSDHSTESYASYVSAITGAFNALQGANVTLNSDGSANFIKDGQGYYAPPEQGVKALTTDGSVVVPGNSLNASLISDHGAGVVAVGAGNVVAVGAGNLDPGSVGQVVAVGAGNVVAVGAGNVVAVGAGNILSNGSSGIVGVGAGNILSNGSSGIARAAHAADTVDDGPIIPGGGPAFRAVSGGIPKL